MKKNLITIVAGVCALALLGGCAGEAKGALSNDNITIKQYKGLEVDKVQEITVTDEDVEMSIKSDLEILATKTDVTGRAAKLGDIAIIDFEGKKDGVAFEGGAGTDYELELGSKTFIDGFEDGIVGHNIGEKFDLNLTFPENYGSADLAGKDVVFTVTLKALKEKNVPELTVDILKELGTEAKTVEEYKAQVKANLEKSNKESAETTLLNSVWEALIKNCEVKKYPEGKVDEYENNMKQQYSYYAQMYGMDIDQFFTQIMGMSAKEMAKNTVTQQLAIALIAEKEGLTIDDKAYEAGVKELAEQYGYQDKEDEFVKAYGEDTIREALLQEKVGNFLVDNCVQVEPKEDKEK